MRAYRVERDECLVVNEIDLGMQTEILHEDDSKFE